MSKSLPKNERADYKWAMDANQTTAEGAPVHTGLLCKSREVATKLAERYIEEGWPYVTISRIHYNPKRDNWDEDSSPIILQAKGSWTKLRDI